MEIVSNADEQVFVVSFSILFSCLTCEENIKFAIENAENEKRMFETAKKTCSWIDETEELVSYYG